MKAAASDNGALMFRCPTSGQAFDSGFRIDQASLATIPSAATMRLRCGHAANSMI
jgi:hypothetical protein